MQFGKFVRVMTLAAAALLIAGVPLLSQVNTVDLSGQVTDPQGLVIPGAKVTAKNLATGAIRTVETNAEGRYTVIGLPPGRYEVSVEASGFGRLVRDEMILVLGRPAEFNAQVQLQEATERVEISETAELIEVRRTAVSDSVDLRRITNLPINARNYINFTLTNSMATRDSSPSIGAAPTSGINFMGQRARSNQVSVDGADATDNSVNAIRSTVSQEAVQEFQLIMSNYMPEFGRATGGVINIVTKSGSNEVHGNVFGYLRHKSIQARNPFSVEVDPATGATRAVKQGFTRVQTGATIGGPLVEDKTFYYLSYETHRRQESGFTNIGAGNFGLVSASLPAPVAAGLGLPAGFALPLTPAQAAFINNPAVLAAPGGATVAGTVFLLAGSGANVALTGIDPGAFAAARGVLAGPGARFPIPIDCSPPAIPCTAANLVPLPASFVPLRNLIGNYPISEGTSFWSARFDHHWNEKHSSFLRVSATPSLVTGIQVNAQNQNFGQNAGSRTSLQQVRDFAAVGQHTTAFTSRLFNEFRFQAARRGLHYGFSQLPGGDQVAINMTGFAFFGREPFSTVDRIERRWQWTDNMTWILGNHSLKFGTDINLIQLRSKKEQIFELNFGGIFNFGGLAPSTFGLPASIGGAAVPGFTAVQAYGLGIPQVFIQGIGTSKSPFDNKTFAFFIQDSWRVHPRFTLNYGVRYDLELTPLFEPATPLNAAAARAFNVVQGIPRDYNNVAPRLGFAWDPWGNGRTLIRGGYGLFYDHPLLALAFNSNTAEGAASVQLISGGGTATRVPVTVNPLALNAGSLFQGVLNALPSMGYIPSQQRFNPKLSGSLFTNQNFIAAGFPLPILPFTIPTAGSFVYAYAQQGNLTVERAFARDYKFSVAYNYAHGLHLNRPRGINVTNPVLLATNYRNALAAGMTPSSPVTVAAPSTTVLPTATTCGIGVVAPSALGALFGCPAPLAALNGQFIGTAAFFNFFRPSGPNPSFAGLAGGYANQIALATAAGYPTGFPGVQVPWSDVVQQESSGNSVYHGMTVNFSKRFTRGFEFLSSWTWSHAIDDSTDLQTLLAPQDNRNPHAERSNSTFDQRHRWVTSAVIESPWKQSAPGWHAKLFGNWVVAPIIELASGRPFTVLTGTDFNLDFGSNTDRPSHVTTGGVPSFFLPEANSFSVPTVCDQVVTLGTTSISPPFGCTGNLPRNAFTRPGFFSWDMRISRRFPINDRWSVEFITDMFNLTNRFNVADVSPLCNPLDPAACRAGEPTAALDPRQFQFALKISW
jgi:hypothetical protein